MGERGRERSEEGEGYRKYAREGRREVKREGEGPCLKSRANGCLTDIGYFGCYHQDKSQKEMG